MTPYLNLTKLTLLNITIVRNSLPGYSIPIYQISRPLLRHAINLKKKGRLRIVSKMESSQ